MYSLSTDRRIKKGLSRFAGKQAEIISPVIEWSRISRGCYVHFASRQNIEKGVFYWGGGGGGGGGGVDPRAPSPLYETWYIIQSIFTIASFPSRETAW